jgi:ppGpp synthetase/RelA/SpoT-type nucleotidyltranferase
MNFSNSQIDKAGRTIVIGNNSGAEYDNAMEIVNAWRSEHRYPLEVFKGILMSKAKDIDINFIFASRLKKMESIKAKLQRESNKRLSTMQDIGGCRIILNSVDNVYEMVNALLEMESLHILKHKTDYIDSPRQSGYRSIHMIYEYHNGGTIAENLKVEVQLRSRLEHIWATSVETASIITKSSLKASIGEDYWLRFFKLVSSCFALQERKPFVVGTPQTRYELAKEIKKLDEEHQILRQLEVISFWMKSKELLSEEIRLKAMYFLLKLDKSGGSNAEVDPFIEYEAAYTAYVEAEKVIGSNAVLVSTNSIETLQDAYPNYFIDINVFISIVKNVLL